MNGILRPFLVGFALFLPAVVPFPSPSSPRSSDNMGVGGVPHLARMADKAALAAEKRLDFDLQYPCPKDQNLLSKLSMGADEFQNLVASSSSDADLDKKLHSANPAAYASAKAALLRFSQQASLRLGKSHDKHHKARKKHSQAEDDDGC